MNDNPKHPADEFVDKILLALHQNDAPYAVREMTDKVYRPFLKLTDSFKADKIDARTVSDAIETTVAMMVTNFASLLTSQETAFADVCQEMVNNASLRIGEDIERRFSKKEPANVLKLPKKH